MRRRSDACTSVTAFSPVTLVQLCLYLFRLMRKAIALPGTEDSRTTLPAKTAHQRGTWENFDRRMTEQDGLAYPSSIHGSAAFVAKEKSLVY